MNIYDERTAPPWGQGSMGYETEVLPVDDSIKNRIIALWFVITGKADVIIKEEVDK